MNNNNEIIRFPNGFTSEDKIKSYLRIKKTGFRPREVLNGKSPRYFTVNNSKGSVPNKFWFVYKDVGVQIASNGERVVYSDGTPLERLERETQRGNRLELTEKNALSRLNPEALKMFIQKLENV